MCIVVEISLADLDYFFLFGSISDISLWCCSGSGSNFTNVWSYKKKLSPVLVLTLNFETSEDVLWGVPRFSCTLYSQQLRNWPLWTLHWRLSTKDAALPIVSSDKSCILTYIPVLAGKIDSPFSCLSGQLFTCPTFSLSTIQLQYNLLLRNWLIQICHA